jgi:hypothetical protein
MSNQTYEVDSEWAICDMCGTRLNTEIEYVIHDYIKFRKVNSKSIINQSGSVE